MHEKIQLLSGDCKGRKLNFQVTHSTAFEMGVYSLYELAESISSLSLVGVCFSIIIYSVLFVSVSVSWSLFYFTFNRLSGILQLSGWSMWVKEIRTAPRFYLFC